MPLTSEERRADVAGEREPKASRVPRGVSFLARPEIEDVATALAKARVVVARADIALAEPGGLRRAIEDAVEAALARRGALPPSVDVDASLDATIRDQVLRTRALGASGLAILLPRLSLGEGGALGLEDSLAMRAWLETSSRTRVLLVIDQDDRGVRVLAPVALEDLVVASIAEEPAPPPAPMAVVVEAHPEEPIESEPPPSAEEEPAAEARVVDTAKWRALAIELDKARGPKPVSVIEKLFTTAYMPLVGAEVAGEIDNAVKGVVETFRAGFEHSYRESFAALRVTGKRPPMVFDAPEIAAKIARTNGARKVSLLLVDAMRFDLGEEVGARLNKKLQGHAVMIERSLLWAALPPTTPVQRELLARGPEALRDLEPPSEVEHDVARGRAVSILRRERMGSRDVMKLDLVEARLRTSGPSARDRFASVAEEVADVIARFVETLPPRTLVYVFGDHGFRLAASADGRTTLAATQGGASPEEVLVPGQAWLVGGVH